MKQIAVSLAAWAEYFRNYSKGSYLSLAVVEDSGISLSYLYGNEFQSCYIPVVAQLGQPFMDHLEIQTVLSEIKTSGVVSYHGAAGRNWLYNQFGQDIKICGDLEIVIKILQYQPWQAQKSFKVQTLEFTDPYKASPVLDEVMARTEKVLQQYYGLHAKLQELGMEKVYELEMKILNIMALMRSYAVDSTTMEAEILAVKSSTAQLEAEIFTMMGTKPFPLSSTKQLAQFLFTKEGLGLTPLVFTGKTKAASTSQEALEQIKECHPALEKIMEWRSLNSVLSSLNAIKLDNGKIPCKWQTIGDDSTSRMYARSVSITSLPQQMRNAFVAPEGKVWVGFDFKQAEYRIFAALSKDPVMLAVLDADVDVHKWTWHQMTGIPVDQVTAGERERAKTLFYAMLYSMDSANYHVSVQLKVPMEEATELLAKFMGVYKGLSAFRVSEVQRVLKGKTKDGCAMTTMLGRVRNLTTEGPALKNQILNTLGQQNCGTILKAVIVKLWQERSVNPQFKTLNDLIPVFDAAFFTMDMVDLNPSFLARAKELVEVDLNGVIMKTSWRAGISWGKMQ